MAKAITSKTESLTIRVPVDLMAELRSEATLSGASVGSVFVERVRSASSAAKDRDVALARVLELELTGDAAETTRKLRQLLVEAEAERQELLGRLTGAYMERDERDISIVGLRADLKKALAVKPISPVVQALRSDPTNRIIDPKVSHPVGPVLADPVSRAATGQAVGFNPKSSWKTEAKGKGAA